MEPKEIMFGGKNHQLPTLILQITCVFWIFTKLFSFNLWHSDRLYPLVPVVDLLDNIPQFIHLSLLFSALSGMLLILIFPKKYYLILITLVIEFTSCMLDQNRWQPYEYQYFITVAFFLAYRQIPFQFLNYFAFLLAVIYFNSGIHKIDPAFLYRVWDGMILHRFFGMSNEVIAKIGVHYSGLLLGGIEFVSALGLLFSRYKKLFAALLIGMHLFILWLISPVGLNYNSIVWPWNIVMVLFLYLIYFNYGGVQINVKKLISGFNIIPFIVLGLLPLSNLIGCFDDFLSFNLYSGSSVQMEICIDNQSEATPYDRFISPHKTFCPGQRSISLNNWAIQEMNVVPYPEERVYQEIISKFRQQHPEIKATFTIFKYPYRAEDVKQYY